MRTPTARPPTSQLWDRRSVHCPAHKLGREAVRFGVGADVFEPGGGSEGLHVAG